MRLVLALAVSCAGSGSTDTGGTTPSETGTDCTTVAPEACVASGCVAIEGVPLVSDGKGGWCIDDTKAPVALDCVPLDTSCKKKVQVADDAVGQRFWFPNQCLPEGFTPVAPGAPPGACDW